MIVVTLLAIGIATVLLLPLISDLLSLAVAATRRPAPRHEAAHLPHLLFLVPAHDEASHIASCVHSLQSLDYPAHLTRIVVLADNCTDETAIVARGAGVFALERIEPERPGKPAAMAWAFARLPLDRFDAVVIVDADAALAPGFAGALARHAPLTNKVVQCYDDVRNPADSAMTRMAAVLAAGRFRGAFALKARAGLTIPLSDGMCIGTGVLRTHGWRAFGLSEDCETYALFTADGVPIELEAGAHLYAEEARNLGQASSQRKRWLAGRFQALARVWPALARSPHVTWRQTLDVLSELAAPGPALHLAVAAVASGVLLAARPPGAILLVALLALTLVRPLCYAVVGLCYVPDPLKTAAAFAFLPVYACWRVLQLVGTIALIRSGQWIRTDRHNPVTAHQTP